MKRLCVRTMAIAALLAALSACQEDPAAPEAQEPPAVAPLEVTPSGETAAGEDDIETLRARIAELEAQVGETEATTEAESGTQTATVPEGVEVPGQEAEPATAEATQEASTEPTRPATRRRAQDRGLLGALLGDDATTTRRRSSGRRADGEEDEAPLGLPDPSRILLGD